VDAKRCLKEAMESASKSRQDLVDIINSGIEELIHNYYELPSFNTIQKEAKQSRAAANRQIYRKIYDRISKNDRTEVRNRFLRYHALRKVKAASDKHLQRKNFTPLGP